MANLLWKKTELSTDFDQDIRITPTPEYDGVELTYKEAGVEKYPPTLYLDRKTMESLIVTLQEMMTYVGK